MTPNNQNTISNNKRQSESGNVFFIIMISVVMFAALMYTFSKGARQGGNNLTEKQAQLAASDILDYAQKLERAVQRAYSKNISENEISFENDFVSSYTNTNCPNPNTPCRVFSTRGGGINWKNPDANANDGTNWIITAHNNVMGIGTTGAASGNDILLMLGGLEASVCLAINEQLGLGEAIPLDTTGGDFTAFTGTYTGLVTLDGDPGPFELNGIRSTCYQDTAGGDLYFYHTLLER